tara:strand:- start:2551 stop:2865 length:315 start_codon:yes stop_codon:yes gene_type:complete
MNRVKMTPLILKRDLLGVSDIETAVSILRNCEWSLVWEMRDTLLKARSFTELGSKNDHLLTFCTMLLEWVDNYHGRNWKREKENCTINELIEPYKKLEKLSRHG